MSKHHLTITINDKEGSVCVVTVDEPNRKDAGSNVTISVREEVNQAALLSTLLSIFSGLPEVHPLIQAKILGLAILLRWYIPKELGGLLVADGQDPLEVLIEGDNDLPF